tara:strand:- start:2129 stop:2293 length:165 start_codon:yes stop_codon:yes gene_type:complete
MRQAYRTSKSLFLIKLQEDNKALALMFIYNKNKIVEAKEIEIAVKALLQKLSLI